MNHILLTKGHTLKEYWEVFRLFLIPIGGGIPGGVIKAKDFGIEWPMMMLLYFFSDVVLACAFEPIMHLFIRLGKRIEVLAKFSEVLKLTIQKTTEHYGNSTGAFALIMIAFGVDPMTGRAVAVAAGHGFITGWLIAITGDMLYFSVLMISTLWLKSVLGDGTWTMFIILFLMMVVPIMIKRIREKYSKKPNDIAE